MTDHAEQFPVTMMCRVLEVSSSGYYSWRGRLPSQRAVANELLEQEVRDLFKSSRQTYGSPRIYRDLRAKGNVCGVNRIAKLMREAGIQGSPAPRFVATTQSNPELLVAKNILNREFAVAAPNRVWSSDITYLTSGAGSLESKRSELQFDLTLPGGAKVEDSAGVSQTCLERSQQTVS